MKTNKKNFLLLIAGLVLPAGILFGQKATAVYHYPEKSAIVEYVYTGSTTGTETWYLDNYGKLSARYSELTTKSLGSTTKTSQVTIQKDTVIYTIDLASKTGTRTVVHIDPKDVEKWTNNAEQAWNDSGFRKKGEETVIGKPCEIWEGYNMTIWIWKNFALRTKVELFDKSLIEAKTIQTGVAVDKSKFDIPADIKMQDLTLNASDPVFDSLGKDLQKGLNDLKDMFAPKKKKQ